MLCLSAPGLSTHLPCPAGLPAESDFVRCEEDRASCYFLNNTHLTYPQAVKACKRLDGAFLVAWNDADEQLRLESYFRVGAFTQRRLLRLGPYTA